MTYEENYLAHYGVRGQKWGVRKYQNEDGSLTQLGKEHYSTGAGGNEKFNKTYKKEFKKYKKLSDRADIDVQKKAAEKHDARAKTAAKIGTAAGLAAASLVGVDKALTGRIANANTRDQSLLIGLGETKGLMDVKKSIEKDIYNRSAYFRNYQPHLAGAFAVASAASAVSFGAAAYNKIAAGVNKRRLTDKGHAKAVAKRDAQYKKITNMVKDTPYAALFSDQIAAYKKEHPNTELSDKQIMKNLM